MESGEEELQESDGVPSLPDRNAGPSPGFRCKRMASDGGSVTVPFLMVEVRLKKALVGGGSPLPSYCNSASPTVFYFWVNVGDWRFF